MKNIKIFLASSDELLNDRDSFGDLIRTLDEVFEHRGVRVRLKRWEDLGSSYTGVRKQTEYNKTIKECDIFVALFHTKAGKYTIEEFDTAISHLKLVGAPNIMIYFKGRDTFNDNTNIDPTLVEFKSRLNDDLGHFWRSYTDSTTLKLIVGNELYSNIVGESAPFETSNSKIYIGSVEVGLIDDMPFAKNNKELFLLKENIKKVDAEIEELTALHKIAASSVIDQLIEDKNFERGVLISKIDKYEKDLLSAAVSIMTLKKENSSTRLCQAMDMFESKAICEVLNILDREKIKVDADIIIGEINEGLTAIRSIIDELKLRATVVMLDITNENKFSEACLAYEDALQYAAKGNLPQNELALLFFEYASFLHRNNYIDRASKYFESALGIYRQLVLCQSDHYMSYVAKILNNLGRVYCRLNRCREAEKLYLEALDIETNNKDSNEFVASDIAITKNNLGVLYLDTNRHYEAEGYLLGSLAIREHLFKDDRSRNLLFRLDSQYNLGSLYHAMHNYTLAEKALLECCDIWAELSNDPIRKDKYMYKYAMVKNNLAKVYIDMKRGNEAERLLTESLTIYTESSRLNSVAYTPGLAWTHNNLGCLFYIRGEIDTAKHHHNIALKLYKLLVLRDKEAYQNNVNVTIDRLNLINSMADPEKPI